MTAPERFDKIPFPSFYIDKEQDLAAMKKKVCDNLASRPKPPGDDFDDLLSVLLEEMNKNNPSPPTPPPS